MKTICVVGNFSGRNSGDNAILECLLNDVYSNYPNVKFEVPTINKKFVEKTYQRFPVKAIPMMPWNFSLKIFGLPILKSALQSDLILVTDAILFDRKLWNPLFNYLSTLGLIFPLAKRKRIPIVLYNSSIGPVTTSIGKILLKRVIESSELIMVRDRESAELLNHLRMHHNNVKICADCALNTPLPAESRIEEILRNEAILNGKNRYLSFNINAYIDQFVKGDGKGIGFDRFVGIVAETMDRIVKEMNVKIILVVTQAMDIKIAEDILERMKHHQDVTTITNKKYTHNELSAVLSRVEMHVGMRTHSIILATSSCTPSIAIVYRPKNRGYMNTIEQSDLLVELDEHFTSDNLYNIIQKTWMNRKDIRQKLMPIIEREKNKAKGSATYLKKYLD